MQREGEGEGEVGSEINTGRETTPVQAVPTRTPKLTKRSFEKETETERTEILREREKRQRDTWREKSSTSNEHT